MMLEAAVTGDAVTGDRDSLGGVIRDLDVQATGFAAAEARFVFDAVNPASQEITGYVDGDLVARLPADREVIGIAGLAEGPHTINIFPHILGEPFPDRHGEFQGRRAYVAWTRSEDPTTRGYVVIQDNVDVATIDTVTIPDAVNRRGLDGEPGRISHYGGYTGTDIVNDVVELILKDDSSYQYTWAGGIDIGDYVAGQSLALPYGVIVEIQDPPSMYGAQSTFEIPVGPTTEYLTDELDPGDYEFSVVAFDEAGNRSTPVATTLVRIYPDAGEVPGVAMVWDADLEVMQVVWDATAAAAAGITTVECYANIDSILGVISDHVIEDIPWATAPASQGYIAFDRSEIGDGNIKLYLRHADFRSVRMVRFTMPPTPFEQGVVLGVPTSVVVVARPDGALRVEWEYSFEDEFDVAAGFEVSLVSTSGAPVFSGVIDVSVDDAVGFPVSRFGLDFAGPYATAMYAVVRVYNDDLSVYNDSDEATGVPDSTPPDDVDAIYGVSQ